MLRRPVPAATSSSYYAPPPTRIPASPPVRRRRCPGVVAVRCASQDGGGGDSGGGASDVGKGKLKVGSPIIIVEAPPMLKTAASVPSLRSNGGVVKPGDVGRIMARRPKDVWAVRLAAGSYLLDGKHFKPLDVGDIDNKEDGDDDAAATTEPA